jgi:hypothetical protein
MWSGGRPYRGHLETIGSIPREPDLIPKRRDGQLRQRDFGHSVGGLGIGNPDHAVFEIDPRNPSLGIQKVNPSPASSFEVTSIVPEGPRRIYGQRRITPHKRRSVLTIRNLWRAKSAKSPSRT